MTISAKLTIIVPAYNEASNILKLIVAIRKLYPESALWIVDGHSKDRTVEIVKRQQRIDKYLQVLVQPGKDGRGAAVIMGMREALKNRKCQYFLEMDADLSHDPQEIPFLLEEAHQEQVIIASRYVPNSTLIDWPIWRQRQSYLANKLINLVLNLGLKDNTNGFRCYPRSAAQLLVNYSFISRGFILLSESAYYLKKKGYRLVEIPSTFRNRRAGKSNASIKELLVSLVNLLRIKIGQ